MRHFLMTVAATAAFAALSASAPANAAENWGPNKIGNQCFKVTPTNARELYFGSWGACPQPASTVAAPTVKKKKIRG
jgi:hypothetical protein